MVRNPRLTMNPEIFTHYGNRLKTRSKRVYRKSLKAIAVSKRTVIETSNTTIHYTKEIGIQAKVFKANFNQLDRFNQ